MTLHHVPDTIQLLRDFYTLLQSAGWLGITDLDQEDGSFHGAGFTGHCGFDREALRAQLFGAGFNRVDFSTGYLMIMVRTVFGFGLADGKYIGAWNLLKNQSFKHSV